MELVGLEKKQSGCHTQIERNKIWEDLFNDFLEKIRLEKGSGKTELIIQGLVLVHPKFSKDSVGNDFRDRLDQSRNMTMLHHERDDGPCQIKYLIDTTPCVYNEFPQFRPGRFVGDHVWPYSLGGPTNTRANLPLNRLILCSSCNGAKSNSIYSYKFEELPNWLVKRLYEIKHKMREIR